jgi:hypothetical protein
MPSTMIFKIAVSSFIVLEIVLLGVMSFMAVGEYDEMLFAETVGLMMVVFAASLGIGTLLLLLYGLAKWNPLSSNFASLNK